MDLLNGNIRKNYMKYLGAAWGSAMISSIYGVVDMAVVGQYQGPEGTAALAVVAPVWNIIYSLGLLTGIGGSVLFGAMNGRGEHRRKNEYFTVALIGTVVLAALCWLAVAVFDAPLLRLFGAEETLLPLARRYLLPVRFCVPLFLFNQMMAAFLRNDGNPGLAARAVLTGGVFNIFGDCFFVFGLQMGIFGAGLATSLGALITFLVMLTHWKSEKNTLKIVRPTECGRKMVEIAVTGFSSFFSDVAMGILTMLFNRQIMKYLGTDALAVYGVIVNVSTIVQCCGYSIGQAAQPIISVNFGAGKRERVRQVLRCALYTAACFGLAWTAAICLLPGGLIRIFMKPTEAVRLVAPAIMRNYGISFLLLPLNIFSTYYFQALLKPGASFAVSLLRGALLSGALILLLPAWFGAKSLWFAMPLTEVVTAVPAIFLIHRYTGQLAVGYGTQKQ